MQRYYELQQFKSILTSESCSQFTTAKCTLFSNTEGFGTVAVLFRLCVLLVWVTLFKAVDIKLPEVPQLDYFKVSTLTFLQGCHISVGSKFPDISIAK